MTKQDKPDEQGDALTPGAIATMRELGWTEARIEAERRNAERIRAAGGFPNWVAMCEAARKASEARGYGRYFHPWRDAPNFQAPSFGGRRRCKTNPISGFSKPTP